MGFDEYVNHISHKYRLAVAISVIKTKPNDLSIEEFLTQLQRKINMESDPNETVCSDDFNFDEDITENHQSISEKADNDYEIDLKSNEEVIQPQNEDSQISQTILEDFVFEDIGHLPGVEKESSVIGDTLKLLKATDATGLDDQPFINQQNSSQLTFCESQERLMNNSNTTSCYSMPNKAFLLRIPENDIDSQETELYTLQGFDYSHVSQTQGEHFYVSEKFLRNDRNLQENIIDTNNIQYSQADNNKIVVTANIEYTPNKEILDNKNINEDINSKPIEEIQVAEYTPLSNDILETQEHLAIENLENAKNINENIEEQMDVDDETDTDDNSQIVKVPFKVLEELNKVRSYLNKKDRRNTEGYSTDSGYRSDSQPRCSFKSSSQYSQLSGAWLNQSAHCLYSYIIQAPTVSDDITNEISQVLGQLIDKLHEEENYPSFLEELLETVDDLVQDMHAGGRWDENVMVTKDEKMHRLNHLNRSKHILRHTIDNINAILEKLHTNLTQENLYELTNIAEIENISYIFHILEILLKRYMKVKNVGSEISTQNSQDVVITKRSSLTDLWRKKWNPNYKETAKTQENVTVCVVKRCSEVLNKIIVECMDGYSLIAYAALQCFNLIQS